MCLVKALPFLNRDEMCHNERVNALSSLESIFLCIFCKEEVVSMTLQFGISLPQGWTMDLVGIKDPVEAY